jgi:hypothetical protein
MTDKETEDTFAKIEKIIRDNIVEFNVPNENKTNNKYYPEYLKKNITEI